MPGFWAHPAPRGPKTWHICSFLPCTIGTARINVPECGIGPDPNQKRLFTKRICHSKSSPDFSIFAPSVLLPTPNERRDQMCQVVGLTWPRGARKPGTFAPSFPAPSERQDQMCRNVGPQSKTPFLRKEFITQNLALVFQFLPAPFSSLHPMNGETKCARFLQQRQGHMCRNEGNPEIGPDPNQKRPFHEKNLSLKIWP